MQKDANLVELEKCFLAKFRFDTAENEPTKKLQKFVNLENFAKPNAPLMGRPGPRCVREDPVAVYQTGADGVPLDEEAALRRILVLSPHTGGPHGLAKFGKS